MYLLSSGTKTTVRNYGWSGRAPYTREINKYLSVKKLTVIIKTCFENFGLTLHGDLKTVSFMEYVQV